MFTEGYNYVRNVKDILLYNGAILVVPALLITFGLWKYLPAPFSQENFSRSAPRVLELFEDSLRILIFFIPVLLLFETKNNTQNWGWYLYGIGIALYACSYLAQILFSSSALSRSFIGFTSTAWTTVFWLYGIALVCRKSWLFPWWRGYMYMIIATVFVILHTYHAFLVHSQLMHGNNT